MNINQYNCGIIGYPLKKPRSIPLWKSFFKKNNINSDMKAFNVKPLLFNNFIKKLKKNKKFLATAISMPYKIAMVKHANKLDSYAKNAKSINLLVKKGNFFLGYNTDIFGAMTTIKPYMLKYNEIVIIGLGGTGKALFNYLYSVYKKKKFKLISTRFKINNNKRVSVFRKVDASYFKTKKIIINCTPLGSNLKKSYLNKCSIDKKIFNKINKKSIIFDVVYSPKKTLMYKLAKKNKITYLNGLKMNTEQAKQALKIIFKKNENFTYNI